MGDSIKKYEELLEEGRIEGIWNKRTEVIKKNTPVFKYTCLCNQQMNCTNCLLESKE